MSKITYIIAVAVFSMAQRSLAQIRAAHLYISDTSSPQLLLHRPNRISITGLLPEDRVSLGTTPPERVDSNVFTFRIDRRTHDTLFVRRRNQVIFSKKYRISPDSDPVLRLGVVNGSNPGGVTVDEILTYPRLIIEPGGFIQWFGVRSFELIIATKDSVIGPMRVTGDCLASDQLELIRQLRAGDKIYFENIRVLCPDNTLRLFSNLQFKIK